MPASSSTKATWDDIRRGADQPPSDNSDGNPSGFHNENYNPPNTPKDYPIGENGSNKPHPKIGDEGKMINYKKAGERLMKSLDSPDVLKAMDILEKAGVFDDVGAIKEGSDLELSADGGSEQQESDSMNGPTPSDVEKVADQQIQRALGPIYRQLESITKMLTQGSRGSESQKSGFIPAGETPHPSLPNSEKAPAYSKNAPSLQKSGDGSDDDLPDFDTLAATRMKGVMA